MNVLLISQCSKKALTETRRILDQFAERRGDRTWQTPITQAGLETLHRLLRKTARKNTAVACHWIRGKDHSELLWIVGDARQFNAQGATPTNSTRRNVLRSQDENDWHSLQTLHLLASLAALLHDLGKACSAFQDRLRQHTAGERNLYRHEWISLRLFQAFVGEDDDAGWLQRLVSPTADDDASWLAPDRLRCDGQSPAAAQSKPFACLPPVARAVGWLVLTHHRLPLMPATDQPGRWLGERLTDFRSSRLDTLLNDIDASWNELPSPATDMAIQPYWHFKHGLPVSEPAWRKRAARLASRLLPLAQAGQAPDWLEDPYLMHLSRLALMLADHHYSSLTDSSARSDLNPAYPLHANTNRRDGSLNQTLDEHLLGVARHAGAVVHALPGFERHLPRLARHKGLRRRSSDPRFRWQDSAADLAGAMRGASVDHGAFIVNMASTGCGKTLANARIMNALADPVQGMRCAFALGLRTLTLQTGQAFRSLLGLGEHELAIRVGGAASRELFERHVREAENSGSASTQALLPEDGGVLFEGNDAHPLLQRLSRDPQVRALIGAPLLVCTVDHLTPATESARGGHQIAPMLRLMSGDLVLDEPDDFDIDDLPALTRLVHWAGLLGSRVLLSSATLPPALVEGLFEAYLEGRRHFQRHRGSTPGQAPEVCCAWVDEFNQQRHDCTDTQSFAAAHLAFARSRHAQLAEQAVRRRAELLVLQLDNSTERAQPRPALARRMLDAALRLHADHHEIDPRSGKRVSFGLMRMANISPLVDVALALYGQGAPAGVRIHLCTYHAQFPLVLRSAIEHELDACLDRRQPQAVFSRAIIRAALDAATEADHLFIVLGSPVTEVGRDHDYDWAVVEPSSMRSLIQLAGRVRRHRPGAVAQANLLVLDTNLRGIERPGKPAFCRPGFEDEGTFRLDNHRLGDLLAEHEYAAIDARPRLLPREDAPLAPRQRLVDLEHARMQAQMRPQPGATLTAAQIRKGAKATAPLNATSFWRHPQAMLTAALPQQQPFRADPVRRIDLVLLPDEEGGTRLHRITQDRRQGEDYLVEIEACRLHRVGSECFNGLRIGPWAHADYLGALTELAEERDMPLEACARRYGTLSLPDSEQGWRYHPWLGFSRK
ncbi:type I-F CRISPR-associated helicase Cas3 [Azoarcus sp. TTM-91]|uniref:type I-F CRISPR-associated helicase Cas3f n=1 Tax=Azoarcus sp. TTM-91 TaxID=2691581 RepID=UPI00145CF5F9|nr:type I-F CRISPR-associated helicase Cas3f [Azoarcus sp. TTM-91]NMG34920.1 type I-F CRISPR-associated helicase Cas3 [Azoarcus sp. TTM-91]